MTRLALALACAGVALAANVARADDPPPGPPPPGEPVIDPPPAPVPAPAPAPAPDQSAAEIPIDPTVAIAQANAAAAAGDWEMVQRYIAPLLPGASLGRGDQAEAHRLAGLAAYFLGRLDVAERELLEYLKLDVEARLDPGVVPPEAVTFFEDVRSRHGAELRALKPRGGRRHFALNLIPPFGQFQNGHKVKGWLIGGGLVALTATHIATYFVLKDWCTGEHGLCETGVENRASTARNLRIVNIATGVGAIGLYVYGVIDGIRHYRKRSAMLRLESTSGGGMLVLSGRW